jgi:hypothetical protein
MTIWARWGIVHTNLEGSPPPAEKRRVREGINRITQDTMKNE